MSLWAAYVLQSAGNMTKTQIRLCNLMWIFGAGIYLSVSVQNTDTRLEFLIHPVATS